MRKIFRIFLLVLVGMSLARADDVTFRRVKVPDLRGKEARAALTFSDTDKAVEVRAVKRSAVNIPYSAIEKCTYEYTMRHRINDFTIITAPIGLGAVLMITKSRSHWLEIDYREQNSPKVFVVRMHKREYIRILDALKTHTGMDAELLGNAQKR